MTEESRKSVYTFTDASIGEFKKWVAHGYYQHLRGAELHLFNVAFVPVFSYLCILLMSYIPRMKFDDSPLIWYFAWGYLCLSVVLFVHMHVRSPRSLRDESLDLMEKEFNSMVFSAHVKSEIEELTEDG